MPNWADHYMKHAHLVHVSKRPGTSRSLVEGRSLGLVGWVLWLRDRPGKPLSPLSGCISDLFGEAAQPEYLSERRLCFKQLCEMNLGSVGDGV